MKQQSEISKKWKSENFSCDLWVDPPAQRWENYTHSVDELVYVLEGTLEFELSGKKQVLRPGDEIFIPKNTNHSVRNISKTEARWLYGYKQI